MKRLREGDWVGYVIIVGLAFWVAVGLVGLLFVAMASGLTREYLVCVGLVGLVAFVAWLGLQDPPKGD